MVEHKPTCPKCGSQRFSVVSRGFGGGPGILECDGWGCGRLWTRKGLLLKPKILKLICPICEADFYSVYAKDWMKRHFEIAHPKVEKVRFVIRHG